jgi:hypothetical protein
MPPDRPQLLPPALDHRGRYHWHKAMSLFKRLSASLKIEDRAANRKDCRRTLRGRLTFKPAAAITFI